MGKMIQIPQDSREILQAEFEEFLRKYRCQGGEVKFSHKLPDVSGRKATVWLTPVAFAKLQTLVHSFDKEIGWHGLARRLDEEKDEYLVYDIAVYPQMVTGTTVNTDQIPYQDWLTGLSDEVFPNVRFHGHSHVNMAVSPSSVDINDQRLIIDQLGPEDFYIFQVWNKRGEVHTKVYDMKKNIFFDNADCSTGIYSEEIDLNKFLADSKGMVREKPSSAYGYYNGGYSYPGTGAMSSAKPAVSYPVPVKEVPAPKQEPAKSGSSAKSEPATPEPAPKPIPATKPEPALSGKPRVPIASGNYILSDNEGAFDIM